MLRCGKLLHQLAEECRIAELQSVFLTAGLQRIDSRRNDFQIGHARIGADQFDAGLGNLIISALERGGDDMDILLIAEAKRERCGTQSGCADTRNRDGIIRTQHHEAPLCIGQLIHLLLREGICVAVEDIIKFECRGDDFAVTACGKEAVQTVFKLTAERTLGKERIARAFGCDSVIFIHRNLLIQRLQGMQTKRYTLCNRQTLDQWMRALPAALAC